MVFAFGHLAGAWLFGKITELFNNKKIPHFAWLFLLLGGILPDIDFLLDWMFHSEIHRTITHSLVFLIFSCSIAYTAFKLLKRPKEAKLYSLALGAGIIVHLIMDMLFCHGVPLFWPSLLHFSFKGINYFDPLTPSFLEGSGSQLRHSLKFAVFDMAIGTAWIFYLLARRKIRI